MSSGDPNHNPYAQTPSQGPASHGYGYGYDHGHPHQDPYGTAPSPPHAAQGYGAVLPSQGYGAPQQDYARPTPIAGHRAPVAAVAKMPGLMTTARVLLYIVSAVQIIIGGVAVIGALAFSKASDAGEAKFGDNPLSDIGNMGAGLMIGAALVFFLLAALSIVLGVKFSRGGQGIRITTAVYGALGAVVGILLLVNSGGSGGAIVMSLLWVVFGGIMATAVTVPSGTAWFNRPRS
ncbi:hypothetical protein AB0929_29265 [Streptomyces massasporeus]|uniref:hypothetical protein n=1 Tax=Streptomyces massasporeus TaxID=67324 RepID=UPI003454923B